MHGHAEHLIRCSGEGLSGAPDLARAMQLHMQLRAGPAIAARALLGLLFCFRFEDAGKGYSKLLCEPASFLLCIHPW